MVNHSSPARSGANSRKSKLGRRKGSQGDKGKRMTKRMLIWSIPTTPGRSSVSQTLPLQECFHDGRGTRRFFSFDDSISLSTQGAGRETRGEETVLGGASFHDSLNSISLSPTA